MLNLSVILLFILLEITPILIYLLSGRGPYDDLLDCSGGVEGGGAVAQGLMVIEDEEHLKPLNLGISILGFVLPAKDQDHVIGDLLEEYSLLRSKHSKARAVFWFYGQILDSAAPLLFKIFRDFISHRIKKY